MKTSMFFALIITILLGNVLYASESHGDFKKSISVDDILNSVCPSLMASVSQLKLLKNEGSIVQDFETQFQEMISSGEMTGDELKSALVTTAEAKKGKISLHLIRVESGAGEKYFYIIPSKDLKKSVWGKLGSARALEDLGDILLLKNGSAIIQSDSKYAVVRETRVISEFWRFNSDGILHGALGYELPFVVRNLPYRERLQSFGAIQYLLDVGILSAKRFKTIEFEQAQTFDKKIKFYMLSFDADGSDGQKRYLYLLPTSKYLVSRTLELGFLDTVEGARRFGERFIIDGKTVIKVETVRSGVLSDAESLLGKIADASHTNEIISEIFQDAAGQVSQTLVMGPMDIDAYATERAEIQNLKPMLDTNSLASIHGLSQPIEDAIAALNHKKRALQKYVFEESFWGNDAEKIGRIISGAQLNNKNERSEADEVLGKIIKTRRSDLVKYLQYLSEIKETSDVVSAKINEFREFLLPKTSSKYPHDLAESQAIINQYAMVIKSNAEGLASEIAGVTQTIAYFKQINIMLAISASKQELDPELIRDLNILHKILSSLASRNMSGLELSSTARTTP